MTMFHAYLGPQAARISTPAAVILAILLHIHAGASEPINVVDAQGRAIMAEIINSNDSTVTLKRSQDQKEFTLPRSKLSKQSLEEIDRIRAAILHEQAMRNLKIVTWTSATTVPDDLHDVVKACAGSNHTLALKRDGTVVAWGSGEAHAAVPKNLSDVIDIDAGRTGSAAVRKDGTFIIWENRPNAAPSGIQTGPDKIKAISLNAEMLLTEAGVLQPMNPRNRVHGYPYGRQGVTMLAGGYAGISLARLQDGSILAWGGHPQIKDHIIPPPLTNIRHMAIGTYHAVAITADGRIVSWCNGDAGEPPKDLPPCVQVAAGHAHSVALTEAGKVVAWGLDTRGQISVPQDLGKVVQISAGSMHTVAVQDDGRVREWGYSEYAEARYAETIMNVTRISIGNEHGIALKNDGSIECWGDNYSGQCNRPNGYGVRVDPSSLKDIVQVSAGSNFTTVLNASGKIFAFGANHSGQCNVPAELSGITSVSAGSNHVLALKSDGTPVAWGDDSTGACRIPEGLNGVIQVCAGMKVSAAVIKDGNVVVWGRDADALLAVPTGLSGVVSVALGGNHLLALKNDGTVVAWGQQSKKQTDVPQGLSDVVEIAAGESHSVVRKKSGEIVAWGYISAAEQKHLKSIKNAAGLATNGFRTMVLTLR